MGRKILIALSLVLLVIVAYIYIPSFSSEAQPVVQAEQPAVDVSGAAEVEQPLVVPTLAIKDAAFSEKQSEPTFDWSKVDASTLSNISYG